MTSTILSSLAGINSAAASTSSASSSQTNLNNTDFMKILLAQMASPDLSSLFGDKENESSNPFGSSMTSMFGGTDTLSQMMAGTSGAGSLGAFSAPEMQLSVLSTLIGKKVYAYDASAGKNVSGTVNSVQIQNGVAMLDVEGTMVAPSTLSKVE